LLLIAERCASQSASARRIRLPHRTPIALRRSLELSPQRAVNP
jgi:hypothetical protein